VPELNLGNVHIREFGLGLLHRLLPTLSRHPVEVVRVIGVFVLFASDADVVGGYAVAPPQLPRDAPVLRILQPPVPILTV